MDKLLIRGGRRLRGSVRIGGAKNASLPALASIILTEDRIRFTNLPQVADVRTMMRLLEGIGAVWDEFADPHETSRSVSVPEITNIQAPYDLVRTMRASVLVLGPLLARAGRARVSLPGGCAIGERPIDMHLEGLRRMGATITLEHGYVDAHCPRLAGTDYTFPGLTVTGTENLMAAACLARGTTVLRNCAREPEVVDLALMLRGMGASIEGEGTDTITIEGRDRLSGTEHRIIPDRIEAGTYLIAAAIAGDEVTVRGCEPGHLESVLTTLSQAGVDFEAGPDAIVVRGGARKILSRDLATAPYPGFPTDMQAQFMVMMTQAAGKSAITETIFEHRFMHVLELRRLGASIRVRGNTATVTGPRALSGADVTASDLRASACLVLAGLVAAGETRIHRVYHLDRGYERMEEKLRGLGADVERESGGR